MRFLIRFLLMALVGYLFGSYAPQWSLWPIFVGGILIGVLLSRQKKKRQFGKRKMPRTYAFWAGFAAMFLLWGGMAYWLDQQNGGILSAKVGQIVFASSSLGTSSDIGTIMVLISSLLGGLAGGFSMMTGNFLGEAIKS
ncbi:MAG: hypothetical protein AAFQ83_05565 [Bacteroidota bacterium]